MTRETLQEIIDRGGITKLNGYDELFKPTAGDAKIVKGFRYYIDSTGIRRRYVSTIMHSQVLREATPEEIEKYIK